MPQAIRMTNDQKGSRRTTIDRVDAEAIRITMYPRGKEGINKESGIGISYNLGFHR